MSNEAKILIGIAVVTIVIVVGAAFFVGGKSSSTTTQAAPLTADQTKKLMHDNSYVSGPKDAKVTLIEFGDFQCPACGAAYPIVEQLLNEYNGKIKFVFREFPLTIHQHARIAADAAEAAGAQGKFYEMYNVLYQNQNDWANTTDPTNLFIGYAKTVGLNVDQFTSDLKNKKYDDKVQEGINDGYAVTVQATPTFFINGEKIEGGLPYDQFKAKIDAAFAAAK